ncbi:hypothetical protein AWZ03_014761 [Drosophila navojoa]|uniref:Uncharacterized protein n=1 Tax=Drosophila navojoa TaxID=7232 RepID=A0A484APU2_DRONA|nr:hypothetical protein AWZ03_014761 [Drosophila navojoa]
MPGSTKDLEEGPEEHPSEVNAVELQTVGEFRNNSAAREARGILEADDSGEVRKSEMDDDTMVIISDEEWESQATSARVEGVSSDGDASQKAVAGGAARRRVFSLGPLSMVSVSAALNDMLISRREEAADAKTWDQSRRYGAR